MLYGVIMWLDMLWQENHVIVVTVPSTGGQSSFFYNRVLMADPKHVVGWIVCIFMFSYSDNSTAPEWGKK